MSPTFQYTLPHVTLTSDSGWDPVSLDNDIDPNCTNWYPVTPFMDLYGPHPFNQLGQYNLHNFHLLLAAPVNALAISQVKSQSQVPDFESLRPKFGWCSVDTIKYTFNHTTQLARSVPLYGSMRIFLNLDFLPSMLQDGLSL
jgi:hypothetical protein